MLEVFSITLKKGAIAEIKEKLKKFDKILIVDIPPSYIAENLKELKLKKIFYTDHHQKNTEISDFIFELRTTNEGYIPSSRTCYELAGGKEWLALTGTIADVGYKYSENNEFINNFLNKENLTLEQYKKIVVNPIAYFLIYFSNNPKKAFEILKEIDNYKNLKEIKKYLQEVESEIKEIINNFKLNSEKLGEIYFYYFKPRFKLKSIIATQLALDNEDKTIITATPSYSEKNIIDFSGRCQSGKFNMPQLLKSATKNLKNASAGGHLLAAGGFIQSKDLEKFKENLKKFAETRV